MMDTFEAGGETYLSTKRVSQLIDRHPGTIRNWQSDGRSPFPAFRFGSATYFRQVDVDAYLAGRAGR